MKKLLLLLTFILSFIFGYPQNNKAFDSIHTQIMPQTISNLNIYKDKYITLIEECINNGEFGGSFLNICNRVVMITTNNEVPRYISEIGTAKFLNKVMNDFPIINYNFETGNGFYSVGYILHATSKHYVTGERVDYTLEFEVSRDRIVAIHLY